jgi:SanA protein
MNRKYRWIKLFFRVVLISVALITAGALLCDAFVGSFSRGKLYWNVEEIPHKKAALLLGTGKYVDGRANLYYIYRLEAAARLWHAGKVDAIIISGDNSRKDYDESSTMKTDLTAKGVPEQFITLDYAGLRTLDSIVRAKKIFDIDDYVVISQPFHCSRAIYIAQSKDLNVIGFCAKNVDGADGKIIRLREVFARCKAIIDVMCDKGPKYLGEKETVTFRNMAK